MRYVPSENLILLRLRFRRIDRFILFVVDLVHMSVCFTVLSQTVNVSYLFDRLQKKFPFAKCFSFAHSVSHTFIFGSVVRRIHNDFKNKCNGLSRRVEDLRCPL